MQVVSLPVVGHFTLVVIAVVRRVVDSRRRSGLRLTGHNLVGNLSQLVRCGADRRIYQLELEMRHDLTGQRGLDTLLGMARVRPISRTEERNVVISIQIEHFWLANGSSSYLCL